MPHLRRLAPLLGLLVLAGALFAARHTFAELRWEDVASALAAVSPWRWALALGCCGSSFAALAAFDVLAVRHLGLAVDPRRAALAGLAGWAVSNVVGPAWLTGGAVRLRVYGRWGVSAADVGRVVAFDLLTFWYGFVVLAGVALTVAPPEALPWARWVGVGLCAGSAAGVAFVALRRPTVLGRPLGGRALLAQLAVVAVDHLAAVGALACFLPADAGVPLPSLVSAFALSNLAGVLSGLPGGAGTFEGLLLALVPDDRGPAALLGAVLAWRVVVGLVPLTLAAVGLALAELRPWSVAARRHAPTLAAPALAGLTFATGLVLLVSALGPFDPTRGALGSVQPLVALEASKTAGATAGLGLLFVARGLAARTREAWSAALGLLGLGGLSALAGGLAPAEGAALAVVAGLAFTARSRFGRRAALGAEPLDHRSALASCLAVGVLAALLVVTVEPTGVAWPRALRALGLLLALGSAAVLGLRLRPARLALPTPTEADVADAVRLAVAAGRPVGWFAATGDKALFFDEARTAFLMVGASGDTWVAFAGPIGDPAAFPELLWAFREAADEAGVRIALYEIPPGLVPVCSELGLRCHKFGEDAHVPLEGFSLEGRSFRNQRQLVRRFDRDGATFAVLGPEEVAAAMPELRAVSDAWLAEKGAREKGFSLGRFDPDWLRRGPVAVVRVQGRVVAFANLLVAGPELCVDLMRHVPDAPNGTMELLFVKLMVWGAERGHRRFGLGMAPLAGLPAHRTAPAWAKLGALVYERGDAFYRFRGLRAYKEKFHPTWEPRYVAVQGRLGVPATLRAVLRLVGGLPERKELVARVAAAVQRAH